MKGIVFTELLAMAEGVVGEAGVDEVLDGLALASGGAYSRVGNYPCSELLAIVSALAARTGVPAEDLQRRFGAWMHARFTQLYPGFFAAKDGPLHMLESIETEVHVEVRKLYPDAELPRFETSWQGEALRMCYVSPRPLVSFCEGLIHACGAHYGTPLRVDVTRVSDGEAVFDVSLER
ncbi:heme NO-binding domain-containing protein [Sagittula stellata]|uniref:Heme NO-binding domain-containing protein n=1 Tax=Sagittula stellata (strain ATCC 700073 / DSM 11524 / E-37) TaxID=388399 RepID=A3K8A6_SAGS3|nr:heme NO-binding domain-containing protein [Sagittula stellata]EBA06585.1 hypothetical protein SSE37_10028 [Sagittula stellata E-37]